MERDCPLSTAARMNAPRTLVCVLAETRSWKTTWPSFKMNVLDRLGADLALCIGAHETYDRSNPFWQSARYRWTSIEHDDYGEAFDAAQSSLIADGRRPAWRKLLGIRNQWLGGIRGHGQHPGSAAILIYFRWLLLECLRSSGALQRYDRFVITRSDFVWLSPHPGLDVLTPDSIWLPDGEYYGGLTDRHAVLTRDDVELYLDLMTPIVCETDALFSRMEGRTDWNLEAYIKQHLSKAGALTRLKLFPYIMYSVREKDGSTRWSKGIWNNWLQYCIKYPSEYAAATFWQLARPLFRDDPELLHWMNGGGRLSVCFETFLGRRQWLLARLARGNTATPSALLGQAEAPCHIVMTSHESAMLIVDRKGYIVSLSEDGSVVRSDLRPGLPQLLHLRAAGRIPQGVVTKFGYRLLGLNVIPANVAQLERPR
jgi:hypothetical protein